MRLRSRLLLLVLAVLVPALVGAAVVLAYVWREQQDVHRDSLRETARALAVGVDRELAERAEVLHALAASPALAAGDLAAFHRHVQAVGTQRQWSIILSDTRGRQLLNSRLPAGAPLPDMTRQEREFRARYGDEPTLVSGLYVPPANLGPHSFAVQVPVRGADGRVERFLMAGSAVAQLQKLLERQRLPARWIATVVDREGTIVARSSEPRRFVGQRLTNDLLARLPEGEGFHHGRTLSGMDGTGFFSRIGDTGWAFVVTVPRADLQGPAVRAAGVFGALFLLLLALAIAAAFAAGRRIAGPMDRLRQAAEALGRNEAVRRQATGIVEMDAVAGALDEAGTRLRRANAELEQKVAEAVASYESSQRALVQAQKLEALGRLTGGIAHDFNNVLQTLTTGLQAARLQAPESLRPLLATCERAVARGSELARQLMVFGRVQEVRVETLDPARRLEEARALLTGALPSNVRFGMDLAPGLWPVTVDPLQLELALLNLAINARDAMPGGGALTLTGRNAALDRPPAGLPPGAYVVLALADTGEGMAPEVLARAVEPFFTTKSVGKGSGMGLAQAYGFARQSGGTLVLESTPGQGTTATFYLPRAAGAPAPAEAAAPAPGLQGGGRVLLVEDDPLVRETVRTGLEAAGFTLRTAATADEALRLLEGGEDVDVVFTDVVMPGQLSGVDLAAQVRRRWPRLRVVIATGYSDRSIDVPGVRTLAKPYDLQQAVQALGPADG